MNDTYKSGDYIDWNSEWAYPLQWLYESMPARLEYQKWCYRVNLAMQGRPWRNLYQEELRSVISGVKDQAKKERLEAQCLSLPEGQSFCLAKAVQTAANQLSSGVDTYEYQVNDPYGIIDDDTEALLAATCAQDYVKNNLGQMSSLITRDLRRYGLSAMLVTYDTKAQKNVVRRIHPKNTWWDTMYSSTGNERFRGYSTMIPWSEAKEIILKSGDEINLDIKAPVESIFDEKGKIKKSAPNKRKIRSLNGLDIYVGDMNKLAIAPGLAGSEAEFYYDYDHDLRSCYNLNWYHTFATDPKAKTKSGYHGQDVELTVIYDLNRHIEFKILNRRFVISKNEKAFKRKLIFPITDVRNDAIVYRFEDFQLDCPLLFEWEDQDERDRFAHPSSILFSLLDLHDELCSWRAKRSHVSKLLANLRIITSGNDSSSLAETANVMGAIIDDIQGEVNSLNLPYSYDPIDSQIAQLELTIKERLSAYDQFDAMQAMGDRASAAESGMANGAVAQGLSTLQDAVMHVYAQIARQMIANRVVYSPLSEFPIVNEGEYSSVTIQQMALDAIVTVKSKMAKKIQEKMLSTSALTLIPVVSQGIFNENGVAMLVEQATMGNIPRKMAQSFMAPQGPSEQEMAVAQQQAANDALALQQNQAMYNENPIPYEVDNAMSQAGSPEEIDELIAQVSQSPEGETMSVENLDMYQQDGAIAPTLQGNTPELGSMLANSNTQLA